MKEDEREGGASAGFDKENVLPWPKTVLGRLERLESAHEARSFALYATIVADRYARLVESSEPADAMREAIRQAEEVVRVWEEVVNA